MKASDTVGNPYYLKDTEGGYYNKYPEFQVWEEGRQACIKEVVEWMEKNGFDGEERHPDGNILAKVIYLGVWQSKLKEWGISPV